MDRGDREQCLYTTATFVPNTAGRLLLNASPNAVYTFTLVYSAFRTKEDRPAEACVLSKKWLDNSRALSGGPPGPQPTPSRPLRVDSRNLGPPQEAGRGAGCGPGGPPHEDRLSSTLL